MQSINDFANFTTTYAAGRPSVPAHKGSTAGQIVNPIPRQANEPVEKFNVYDFINRVESGQEMHEDELADGMQHLIDSGLAFRLQGWWGRQAMALIAEGLCTEPRPLIKSVEYFYLRSDRIWIIRALDSGNNQVGDCRYAPNKALAVRGAIAFGAELGVRSYKA